MTKVIFFRFLRNLWWTDLQCFSKLFSEKVLKVLVKGTLKPYLKLLNANKKSEVLFKSLAIAFFFLWLFCPGHSALGQNYDSAAGLRLSYGGLGSYKHRVHNNIYGEGIVAIRWGGARATGLIEWHFPAFDTER